MSTDNYGFHAIVYFYILQPYYCQIKMVLIPPLIMIFMWFLGGFSRRGPIDLIRTFKIKFDAEVRKVQRI